MFLDETHDCCNTAANGHKLHGHEIIFDFFFILFPPLPITGFHLIMWLHPTNDVMDKDWHTSVISSPLRMADILLFHHMWLLLTDDFSSLRDFDYNDFSHNYHLFLMTWIRIVSFFIHLNNIYIPDKKKKPHMGFLN